MVMEKLESLVNRARGTLALALAYGRDRSRSRSSDSKREATQQQATPGSKHSGGGSRRRRSRDSANPSRSPSSSKAEPRPSTHEDSKMRGHYEGVPMQEYLAPSPHTVGVPVPDVHPATPHRPPIHPRPTGGHEHIGIPQHHSLPRNYSAHTSSDSGNFSRPVSAHSRHRDFYSSERHIVRGSSSIDRLHKDYVVHQVTAPTDALMSPSSASRSADSVWSIRSMHSDRSERRSKSDRRRSGDKHGSHGSHRSRPSPERPERRRRSKSPPLVKRSRSREGDHHGQGGSLDRRSQGTRGQPPPAAVNPEGGRPVPNVYTISGSETAEVHQIKHIRHLQPVQPQLEEEKEEASLLMKWRDAVYEAVSKRDLEPIKPLLPTCDEAIDCLAQPQVIALVCGIITAFLMVLALSSSDWLLAVGWRQGLFAHCIGDGAPKPLPFQINAEPGCHTARDEPYIMASAALCVICLLLDVLATLMTGLGLSSNDPAVKSRYYRIAVWVMTIALIAILIALILYPVFFAQELELGNRSLWEFGWAYGVGWGAAIFLFGAVVLLLCDQEEEEIYYKERTIIHAENDSRA